jgi:hypothetical protein
MSKTLDAATLTGRALQRCITALLCVFIASVILAPPKHFAHWIVMGVYLLILIGGFIGSTKQARCLLRVYWISQFIMLVLTLGAIIFGIVVMVQEMKHAPHTVEVVAASAGDANDGTTSTTSTSSSSSATATISVDGSSSTDSTGTGTTTTIGGTQSEIDHHNTMTTSHGSPAFIIVNVVYLVVFLLILAIKVRSILLAQKLLNQMEELPYMDDSQIELESQQALSPGSEYSVVETQQYSQPTMAAQPVYLVQAHYVPNSQPDMAGVPMVLVDQYGNVVTPQQ